MELITLSYKIQIHSSAKKEKTQLWQMDFISPVVSPIVESLIVPIKKRLCFLVSSTKYVKDMNKEMDQLKLTEQDVKEKKKTADSNSHEVSHHVSAWLDDVQKMKDKTQTIPTSQIRWFNVAKRYKEGKQSYAIRGQIKALIERNKSDINWTNEQKSLAKKVMIHSSKR
ncbi:hypothetical protein L1987_17967 [Smallanthus sonchifolius]|uniref:Uncharacterized protein n=1 Tax=Smallanthus sonchifolius TaxID=185202 RepID=A0ACB9IYG4_9ASTR|nr:hypothetical protein L1987_17967 [Smallanthus sonchifolius]